MHKALGRGLESLISVGVTAPVIAATGNELAVSIPIEKIKPNRFQPRTNFNEEKLKELSDSIAKHGLTQPLLVAPSAIQGEYELIAGERRWRACQMAGLKEVVAVIRRADDKERLQLALIENIQRENLNPVEEAKAYRRLMSEFSYTQEALSGVVGKDRSVVANSLRLLQLPEDIQKSIEEGILSAGHGRVLAGLDDAARQKTLADRILVEKLTVREVEKIVADWKTVVGEVKKRLKIQDVELIKLAEELQRRLGTKVKIVGKAKRGRIEIQYFSLEDLERIAAFFKIQQSS